MIVITTKEALDIISDALNNCSDKAEREAVEYIKYFLEEYEPIEDFTNTHILSTQALYNALPLLDSYYQWVFDDSWKQLKDIMFADENMEIPKRYPSNQCHLYSLLNVMFYRIIDEEHGYKNLRNPKPKILVNSKTYGVLDFTHHYFMDERLLIKDLLDLSKIWNDLYIESETAKKQHLHIRQLEIAERLIGKRFAYDFCELMKWLHDGTDVFNEGKGEYLGLTKEEYTHWLLGKK